MSEENKDLIEDMSENQTENTESEQVTDVYQEVSENETVDEEELRAKQHGWDPSKGSKTAREFNLTGDLIELRKELSKRDRMIEEIYKYQQNTIQEQKKRFREELELRLQEARQYGDVEAVEKLAEQKVNLQIQDNNELAKRDAQEQMAALSSFEQRNAAWFNKNNPDLIKRCQELDMIYRSTCTSYDQLAEKIERQMRAELSLDDRYAHLVAASENINRPNINPNRSAVNRSATESIESDSKILSKLSSNEKAMYEVYKRIGDRLGEKTSVKDFVNKMNSDKEV